MVPSRGTTFKPTIKHLGNQSLNVTLEAKMKSLNTTTEEKIKQTFEDKRYLAGGEEEKCDVIDFFDTDIKRQK